MSCRTLARAVFCTPIENICMEASEEKLQSRRTLVCLLQALEGRKTTIELRNESSASGRVDHVDGMMNVTLSAASFYKADGTRLDMANLFIKGRQIRYVHIPEDVDVMAAIRKRLSELTSTRRTSEVKGRTRGRGRGRAARPHIQLPEKTENVHASLD